MHLVDSCSPHRVHTVLWARGAVGTYIPMVGSTRSMQDLGVSGYMETGQDPTYLLNLSVHIHSQET